MSPMYSSGVTLKPGCLVHELLYKKVKKMEWVLSILDSHKWNSAV